MIRFFIFLTVLVWPFVILAQDDNSDEGFIVNFIEDNLSGVSRDVQLKGFTGALSSRATLDRLTIADDDGIWLTLEDVVLDWNRSALLSGELIVRELTAGRIELARMPKSEPSAPTPEATEFSLPELPVSIDIASINAEEIVIGAPILGEEARFQIEGSLTLAGGQGRMDIDAERIDGKTGVFDLGVGYANTSGVLSVNLSLEEGRSGLISTLSGLHGAPALSLTAQGEGPVDTFTTDIALSTDDVQRLTGTMALRTIAAEDPTAAPTRAFDADISGDIATLFAPEFRAFFGPSIQLQANGQQSPDGRISLDRFNLSAASLRLAGRAAFNPDGWPQLLDLTGQMADPSGDKIRLPIAGDPVFVTRASMRITYDGAQGDGWKGRIGIAGLEQSQLSASALTLIGGGTIQQGDALTIGRVFASLNYAAQGLAFDDPGLSAAVGDQVDGDIVINIVESEPIDIPTLRLNGLDYSANGRARIDRLDNNLNTTVQMQLAMDDLARLSELAGRPLRGDATADIQGNYMPLSGEFDITLDAAANDLAVSQRELDRVIAGQSTITARAIRTLDGTQIENAILTTPNFNASVDAQLGSETSSVTYQARLNDVGLITPDFTGPFTLEGTALGFTTVWQVNADATAPGNSTLNVAGGIATNGNLALNVQGQGPLAALNPFIEPRNLRGVAQVQLAINGPPQLSSVLGTISTQNARLSAPTYRVALDNIDGRLELGGGRARVNVQSQVEAGGNVSLDGSFGLLFPYFATLEARLREVQIVDDDLYQTSVSGGINFGGPLIGGAVISGDLVLGPTEIQVPSTTITTLGAIPDITHIGEPIDVRRTRERAGLLDQDDGVSRSSPYLLNITVRAPGRMFVRGRGLDAELGGQLRLSGTSAIMIPSGRFELVRGRLDILQQRFELDEGWAQLEGDFNPVIRLVATTETATGSASIIVEGDAAAPEVNFASTPELPDDEILAQLFFGRELQSLSALQALQLASAVATLAGRGDGGVVNRLRESTGLDDLDVTSGDDGETALRAGKYLSDNVYTDVTVGSNGSSEINLNLDVGDNVTIKGGLDDEGNTGIGLFFERDY
ncbi:translocation/assembly module TamB domain-containing protein [Parasulfitobacter algicola]|uniref:Translocation/assembly module TamB domain-containing protein n=1 Tax=Parasulfitobacter algicola TaxID=2614809 RepID=A0ABX2ITG7_9RHOB|nr:translocation/assembly module TamB domain-containing protein [Sulfitobacter algicola]NSX55625.1 translocation/assembly module TamB domain-containing protein [Sulfitobacter algicola]